MINKLFTSSIILTGIFTNIIADDDFTNFLNVLEETTQIATKNKINADYAPGIITILKYEDLKRMGIKDFYEALQLIPSVDIGLSPSGTKNIITRGIGGITGSGKTKIMINGVGQNSNASGIIHYNLPIDIIDRIEVIRGPASALYGEYAFSGVINIITKKDTNVLFYLNDSNGYTTGTTLSYKNKNNNLSISANLITQEDKGFEQTSKDINNNDKEIETLRKETDFISSVKYKNLKLNISLNKAKKGEFYGLLGKKVFLPNKDDKENFRYDYKTIELSNEFSINTNFKIIPKVGILQYNYWFNSTKPANMADIEYNKNYIMIDSLYTQEFYNIVAGIEKSKIEEKDSISQRIVNAMYIHDNIQMTNQINLNIGIRYENYNDNINKNLKNYILPRVAWVYRYNEINTFKMQYGKAYRGSTFLEDSKATVNLNPEIIDTYELQHIYRINNNQLSTTLFYSLIQDMIIKDSSVRRGLAYINKNENIISKGIEVEHTYNLNNDYLLSSNLSYNNVYEKKSKKDIGKYAQVLANFSFSYLPYSKFSSTLYLRYIGSKNRELNDIRSRLKAQYTVDLNFKYIPKKNNLIISFGIKNISDSNLKVPSSTNLIDDDYIDEQRNYFIGVNYKF